MAVTPDQIWLNTKTVAEWILLCRAYLRTGQSYFHSTAEYLWFYVPGYVEALSELDSREGSPRGPLYLARLETLQRCTSLRILSLSRVQLRDYLKRRDNTPLVLTSGALGRQRRLIMALCFGRMVMGKDFATVDHPRDIWTGSSYVQGLLQQMGTANSAYGQAMTALMRLVLREIPDYSTLRLKESMRLAWTTLLGSLEEVILGWAILLSTFESLVEERLYTYPLTMQIIGWFSEVLYNVDGPARYHLAQMPALPWDELVGPPTFQAPAPAVVTAAEIIQAALTDRQLTLLLRAYYRSGQLAVADRPYVFLLPTEYSFGTGLTQYLGKSSETLEELPTYDSNTSEMRAPVVQAVVTAAMETLTPPRQLLYRLYQFGYLLADTSGTGYPIVVRLWVRQKLAEDLTSVVGHPPMAVYPLREGSTAKERFADSWQNILLNYLPLYSLMAYVEVAYLPVDKVQATIDAIAHLVHRQRLAEIAPVIQAYLHLIQALLRNPTYPVEEAMLSQPPFPQVYTTTEPTAMGSLNLHLIPELNTLVGGYVAVPTFDQVLLNLQQLL